LETLRDFIRWGASRFQAAGLCFGHGSDNALDEAAYLVAHAVHLGPTLPEGLLDARLTPAERAQVAALLQRRIDERLPAAYLTGEAWFAGLSFKVDPRVLVPRSPIAELIEAGFEPWLQGALPRRVLDLCAGSGCIGIACAHAFPQAEVDVVDLSGPALEVARENIALHGLDERVRALQGDLFEPVAGRRYDLIVSNPPYVDAREMARLAPEYRQEPALGLDGGATGIDLADRILAGARAHLEPEGLLVVEVGASWPALEEAHPELPLTWLEFERGGEGVFLLRAADLPGSA
jgi:ribosomal protein L3 glutamine methyltransferase